MYIELLTKFYIELYYWKPFMMMVVSDRTFIFAELEMF